MLSTGGERGFKQKQTRAKNRRGFHAVCEYHCLQNCCPEIQPSFFLISAQKKKHSRSRSLFTLKQRSSELKKTAGGFSPLKKRKKMRTTVLQTVIDGMPPPLPLLPPCRVRSRSFRAVPLAWPTCRASSPRRPPPSGSGARRAPPPLRVARCKSKI